MSSHQKLPSNRIATDPSRPTPLRLWLRFSTGIIYLALISTFLSLGLQYSFIFTFAVVLGGTLVCSALALTWITLWAQRRDSQLGQFGIGSLMFLTLFAAIFCAVVRSITSRLMELHAVTQADDLQILAAVGAVTIVIIAVSLAFVLRLIESLLKAAVWLVRQRWLRRIIGTLRGKKA
jgi:hypothetical protein